MARKITSKYVFPVAVILAAAGLLQSARLNKKLETAHDRIAYLQGKHRHTVRQFRDLQRDANGTPDEKTAGSRLAVEERDYYRRRMKRLEERIAFQETAMATVRAPSLPAGEGPGAAPAYTPGQKAADVVLPLFLQPETRELLRFHILTTIEHEYEPLFSLFNYDTESEETLIALLLEKKWNAMHLRLVTTQDGLAPELRDHAATAIRHDQDDLRQFIFDFLGPEDFDVYDDFERTQPERQRVDQLHQKLLLHDMTLTDVQQQRLIMLLHEENTSLERLLNEVIIQEDSSELPPELLAIYLNAAELQHQRILSEARNILGSEQIIIFEDFTAAQRVLQEASVRRAIRDANPER